MFDDLGLIEVLDNGVMFMSDIQTFIGRSSTEADRKRVNTRGSKKERKIPHFLMDKTQDKNPDKRMDKCPTKIHQR